MKRAIVIGLIGVALFFASGGSSPSGNTFVLSEFTVIPPAKLRAGNVLVTANNVGQETHELVIVRAPGADALPMNADGSVDESKLRGLDKVGVIDDVPAHGHASARFDLTEGTYVAFCDLIDSPTGSNTFMTDGAGGSATGHVHFALGMHGTFTVS
jgi:hypothetical protein